MANAPEGHAWDGFTPEQGELLESLDFIGNNGWAQNSQSEDLMPKLLERVAAAGMTLEEVKAAMASIGYHKDALHQLDRWESKRTTGRFGR
ncbi:MAG TPA: hypothetical protein VI172_08335 [Candidatus Dormibacteraeota bacterium]|jgi:hypothetical protein